MLAIGVAAHLDSHTDVELLVLKKRASGLTEMNIWTTGCCYAWPDISCGRTVDSLYSGRLELIYMLTGPKISQK